MRLGLVWILFGVACAPSSSDDGRNDRDRPKATESPETEAPETELPETVPSETDAPEPSSETVVEETDLPEAPTTSSDDLFDDTVLHHIEIGLPDTSWEALVIDPYEYVPGSVTVDGVYVDEVGVRLRGKLGSFQEIHEKPKWKIDINRYVAGQRVFDVKAISLNNSVVDCSYMREILSFDVFRAAGAFAPRVAFTQVTVNGLDYGLYQIMETQDDVYLEERYADPTGNLYDGKYVWGGGWFDFSFIDFTRSLYLNFDLEEGTDVGHADVRAVTEALANHGGTPDFYAELDPLIDWEQFHRYFLAEQYVDNGDGYAIGRNNYRAYFRATDGRLEFQPFDFDYSLQTWSWFGTWDDPSGEVVAQCWDDEVCLSTHADWATTLIDEVEAVDWQAKIDAWDALTYDAAAADPRRECDVAGIAADRDFLRGWMTDRPDELRAVWGY